MRTTRAQLVAIEGWAALVHTPRDIRIPLRAGGEVYARTDTLAIDLETLAYSMSGYYFPADVENRVVLDLGAHKGYFAAWCLQRGCSAVYSLEPESHNFRCLERARGGPRSGTWFRERRAVGAASGHATLQVSTESWSHSLLAPPSGGVVRTEEVEVVGFGDLLQRVQDDNPGRELVVKLNVEGVAGDCLLSVEPNRLAVVQDLFVDVEETTPQPMAQITYHLARAGFEVASEQDGVWHFVRPGSARAVPHRPSAPATRPNPISRTRVRARALARFLPWSMRRLLGSPVTPPPGKVRFGDLRRTTPIDRNWGYERGGPIDRHYIERFLERHRADIRGRVLEIGDDSYTRRFGGNRVTRSDVLHVQEGTPGATFVGDLARGEFLPDGAFDAIILTQTLHLIFDFPSALRTLERILAPGGVLLLTVPGITPVDRDEWGASWHYSFTEHALARMFDEYMPGSEARIDSYGNALAAVAFLHGLGAAELSTSELDDDLSTHRIVHTARLRRHPEPLVGQK